MPPKRRIALLLPLAGLLGCGSTAPITPSTPVTPNISGNWQMQIQSTNTPPVSLLFDFLGALTVQGSTATGTFRVAGTQPASSCPSSTQDIPFTGSIDATNLLTLTSAPFSGSVATLKLQLPVSQESIANGTATITGGTCALPSAFVIGVLVPPIAGTYTGTLTTPTEALDPTTGIITPITGISGPATISFTQSAANADGQFPVTANLTFTSPACTLSTTFTGVATGLDLDLNASAAGSPDLFLSAGLPVPGLASIHPILFAYNSTPTCAIGNYSGSFTSQ